MPKIVHLEVLRAKAEEPHVRVVVEAWYLGGGRWWMEPSTSSRMGELRPAGWMVLADELDHYAGRLRAYAGKTALAPVRRRRHRVRRKP